VPHLLGVLDSLVFRHVDDEHTPAGAEHARGFPQNDAGLADMMKHEPERRGIECSIVDRQRLEVAWRSSTFSSCARRRRALASISLERSTAITRSTCGAISAAICPLPQPRSPTTSVRRGKPRVPVRRSARRRGRVGPSPTGPPRSEERLRS